MSDYSKGKIYKITSKSITGECYIGSTIQTLNARMVGHKTAYNKNGNITSKLIVCYGDAIIELIEDYPCVSRTELERREGFHIREHMNNDEMDDVVNYQIAGRTRSEWYQDNITEVRQKHKLNYSSQGKKEYYQDNRPEILRKRRIYHDEHKEYYKLRINCEYCNSIVRRTDIRVHQRTLKCQEFQPGKVKIYDVEKKEARKVKINCEFCGELRSKTNMKVHHRTLKCQAFQEQKSKNGFSVA